MLTHELPRGHFPPPSEKAEVDSRLDDVVLKAMQSEPDRRYPNVSEMRTEVDAVRTGNVADFVRNSKADALATPGEDQRKSHDFRYRLRVEVVAEGVDRGGRNWCVFGNLGGIHVFY